MAVLESKHLTAAQPIRHAILILKSGYKYFEQKAGKAVGNSAGSPCF
jgi:hypothetical protein